MPNVFTYEEVLAIVCAELQQMFPHADPITADTDVTRDIPLDSAGTMTLVFELENKIDVSLPLNELANISRVEDLVKLIIKSRQTPAAEV